MMSFRLGNDAKIAKRVPNNNRACPLCAANQCKVRSPSDMPLCKIPIEYCGKRACKLLWSCGVKLISGTNNNTCAALSCAKISAAACKYTSVLPLPVTPYNKKGANPVALTIACTAPNCSSFKVGKSAVCWSFFEEDLRFLSGFMTSFLSCAASIFKSALSKAIDFNERQFLGNAGKATSPNGR